MEQTQYHVVLEGSTIGPYDRGTIIGMRIKRTLGSEHELVSPDGTRLTVGDLVRKPARFNGERTGGFSLVQATFTAALLKVEGRGFDVPRFRGEIEARVQTGVLRLAGRFRKVFAWKEDRVKLPLSAIVHARLRGSLVDMWLKADGDALQRLTLEIFSPDAAAELVEWLPQATPYPGADSAPAPIGGAPATPHGLIVAVVGMVLTVAILLAALLLRRH